MSSHHLVKIILVPQIAHILMQKYQLTENQALHVIYTSATAKCLADDDLGLYGQGPLYLASLIEEDMQAENLLEKCGC